MLSSLFVYSHSRRSARSKSARSAKPSSRAAASMSSGSGWPRRRSKYHARINADGARRWSSVSGWSSPCAPRNSCLPRARSARRAKVVAQAQLVEQLTAQGGRGERADRLELRLLVDDPLQLRAVECVRVEPSSRSARLNRPWRARRRLSRSRRAPASTAWRRRPASRAARRRSSARSRTAHVGVGLKAQLLEHAVVRQPRSPAAA